MVPVTTLAAYSAAARLQHARATRAGITGQSQFPRPQGVSRRFVVARGIAVFRRDSITRDADPVVPSFSFCSLPRRRGSYPRRTSCWELDPRPSAPFGWEEPRDLSRDQTSHVARTVRQRRFHPSPPPPICRAATSQPRLPTTSVFRQTRAARVENGLGTRRVATQDAFDWSEILAHHEESLRRGKRVRFIAAQLEHPFTHRSRSLRHEFIELPRRADSSPFRRGPAAVSDDVSAPTELREGTSRQSLQPTHCQKTGTLWVSRSSSSGLTPH
jgi:hypothetical protein